MKNNESFYHELEICVRKEFNAYIKKLCNGKNNGMACSVEYLTFMLKVIIENSCQSVADMGIGISTIVLRKFQHSIGNPLIISADPSLLWIGKIKHYLDTMNINSNNIGGSGLLKKRIFDFISYDYGFTSVREKNINRDLSAIIHSGTILLIDDYHKPTYTHVIDRFIEDYHFQKHDIRSQTRDRFGRYSILLTKRQNLIY